MSLMLVIDDEPQILQLVDAVLAKPFTQDEMLTTVRSLIEVSVAC